MQHRMLVPSLAFGGAEPAHRFRAHAVRVNQTLRPWEPPVIDGRRGAAHRGHLVVRRGRLECARDHRGVSRSRACAAGAMASARPVIVGSPRERRAAEAASARSAGVHPRPRSMRSTWTLAGLHAAGGTRGDGLPAGIAWSIRSRNWPKSSNALAAVMPAIDNAFRARSSRTATGMSAPQPGRGHERGGRQVDRAREAVQARRVVGQGPGARLGAG